MEQLNYVARLDIISQTIPAVYHLLTHMFTSIAAALNKNKRYLAFTSRMFRHYLKELALPPSSDEHVRRATFASGQSARM